MMLTRPPLIIYPGNDLPVQCLTWDSPRHTDVESMVSERYSNKANGLGQLCCLVFEEILETATNEGHARNSNGIGFKTWRNQREPSCSARQEARERA